MAVQEIVLVAMVMFCWVLYTHLRCGLLQEGCGSSEEQDQTFHYADAVQHTSTHTITNPKAKAHS